MTRQADSAAEAASRHGLALVETRLAPLPFVQHLAQVLDRVPHVDEAQVQRREAEAQDVRAPRKSPITPRAISACTIA